MDILYNILSLIYYGWKDGNINTKNLVLKGSPTLKQQHYKLRLTDTFSGIGDRKWTSEHRSHHGLIVKPPET